MKILILSTLLLLTAHGAHGKDAPLQLAGIFKSNMVLQQNSEASIWGKATPDQKVTLTPSWSRKSLTATADSSGKWLTKVPTPKAGGPFTLNVEAGKEKLTLTNILIGEVWICGGQSNMQWKMVGFGKDHWKEDLEKADLPQIRLCNVAQIFALSEQDDLSCNWSVCSARSASQFSAVAYFFGEQLHRELKVPIGLISSNWGGTTAEAWTSSDLLGKKYPDFEKVLSTYPALSEAHGDLHTRSKRPPKPLKPGSPSGLYNAMIHPLIPFTFRGVIWYQGESNIKRPEQYRTLFPDLITDWRSQWNQGDFPFYYVQIAPYHYRTDPYPAAFLREAQLQTLSLPNTGMVVTMDIGNPENIHPKKKKPVAERLARLALARTYGQTDLVSSGPQLQSFKTEKKIIRLSFTHLGSGLATRDDEHPSHFTIAGKDQKFHPAEARIVGNEVHVTSKEVSTPLALRYAWGNDDEPNLTNKEGLPASSFRTDDWPIVEAKLTPRRKK
ncbi:MAG: sialate O-acetylesterase [Akkermansiaceae bacterium]